MMDKKLSPIEFYWEYTNREASALVQGTIRTTPPIDTRQQQLLGLDEIEKERKDFRGGKEKK